jgi:hypothetical protein
MLEEQSWIHNTGILIAIEPDPKCIGEIYYYGVSGSKPPDRHEPGFGYIGAY